VHGAHVIAVGAVLGGQLPVAFIGVGRAAPQDFQAVLGLIDDVIDDLGGFTQVLLKRNHIGIETAEQEATVVAELRHLLEVVGAVGVELLRVTAFLLVLRLQQLTVVAEGPAVKRAGKGRLVAPFLAAQCGATMRASVEDGFQLAILGTGNDHRLATDSYCKVVTRLRDLALVGQVNPVALENILHLQIEQFLIGEDAAITLVASGFRIGYYRVTYLFGEFFKLAGHIVHSVLFLGGAYAASVSRARGRA